ncbi:polysaccharide export protein [Qipengyuania sp. 1NDW9]|nr:polysaccharide biosynthesis/export family protein [Qipengyuania xiapuensis]MBX7492769.1 polysaccharide export protein [Qipengyuania xiapuensis]
MSQMLRKTGLLILALLGSLSLASCGGAGSLASIPAPPGGEYRVNTGDSLQIAVQDLDAADGEYTVDDSGTISLPMIKEIEVRGLTFREIGTKIEDQYRSSGILNAPVVNVQPAALRPYYVLGEVNRPGEFEYRQGMTVLAAISAAGGYTYRADTKAVEVTRTIEGREVVGRADETTVVQPGDRIRVFERWF